VSLLNLVYSLLSLPIEFGGIRDGNKVQGSPRVVSIHHLERGKAGSLARGLIEGKFHMMK